MNASEITDEELAQQWKRCADHVRSCGYDVTDSELLTAALTLLAMNEREKESK